MMLAAERRSGSIVGQGFDGEVVLLIHGLWMTGLEMHWLGSRLIRCGFKIRYFHYRSLSRSPRENARRLADHIAGLGLDRLHLLAHSLGGIVVLHLFELGRVLPEGRVLLLGSPVLGSGVARAMMAHTGLRSLLGRSGIDGLTQAAPEWHGERDLGVIAGTMALGVGRLFGGLQGANDGTVSVCETRLQGATDFVTLAVNHMGMLFSSGVAREACRFLHYGRFDRGVVKSRSLDSVRK
ncbi:MAG: alpha/beta hydrolase [Chromatiaceae bacterium]|nr:alpha/beta hydrolase [Chromatiaceae bacterium]